MGESARSTSEGGMVQCDRCGGRYEIRGEEGRARKALSCHECGHTIDAWVLPVVPGAKWTLVDSSGTTTTFSSWPELLTALRSSGISAVHEKTDGEEKAPLSRSAAALLENTPQAPPVSARPKLSVVDKREAETQDPPPVKPALPPPAPAPANKDEKKEDGKGDDWADDVEMISLRDIQVVLPATSQPPLPPPRGTLRTLPPAAGSDAPPPPTISVEEVAAAPVEELDDADVEPAPPTDRSPVVKKESDEEKAEAKPSDKKVEKADAKPSDKKVEKADAKPSDKAKSERKAEAAPRSARATSVAPKEPEPDTKTWLMPVAAIAVAAAGIAFAMKSTPEATPTPTTQPAPTTTAQVAPTQEPTATAPSFVKPTETAPADTAKSAAVETAPKIEPATKAATETVKTDTGNASSAAKGTAPVTVDPTKTEAVKKPVATDNEARLPLAEQLEAAGKARRSGDFAHAKDLYNRALAQSPGNVEAYSGLGAIARSTGDLAAAKDSYQKALGSSPGFLPALIGLADVEWELGDKSSARQHYEQYAKSASSVPDRVRERTQPQ